MGSATAFRMENGPFVSSIWPFGRERRYPGGAQWAGKTILAKESRGTLKSTEGSVFLGGENADSIAGSLARRSVRVSGRAPANRRRDRQDDVLFGPPTWTSAREARERPNRDRRLRLSDQRLPSFTGFQAASSGAGYRGSCGYALMRSSWMSHS